jgi:anti-sigma factor RsiW
MNADQVRDKFADAVEGTLGAEREAFEAALAADEELKDEFALYQTMMRGTRALGEDDAPEAQPSPALLPDVQRKIRVRSKGRFFRDRFATEAGGGKNTLTLVMAMAVLLLIAMTIVIVQGLVVVELPESPPAAVTE